MEQIEFKISDNTTGEFSSANPAIRMMRSRFGTALMVFVATLYPVESFSATCQLKTAPVCIDSVPACRSVIDNIGNTVLTCLSTAVAPPGALVTTASCWQYKGVYDCLNQSTPTYTDTCLAVKNGGTCKNYAEVSSVCNPGMPLLAGGACPLFDVTYQCETAPGNPYAETTCNSTSTCVDKDGNPSFCVGATHQETNHAFGQMVAGQETAREAGVYAQKGLLGETDPSRISIFKGEPDRCSEGMWGAAPNCCKPNTISMSATNALITNELIMTGWNQIASQYVGSGYMFDTLLDKMTDLIDKALTVMQDVMQGVSSSTSVVATTASNIAGASGAVGAAGGIGVSLLDVGNMVGGAVGGAVVGQAAGAYASKQGANTGFAGTASAVGSAVGTVAGTYGVSFAMYAGTALMNGAVLGQAVAAGSAGASGAVGAICWVCLIVMIVISIIMSFAACAPEDASTQLKLGAPGLCHFVGTYCNTHDFAGGCITTMQQYCCFNGRLGRIIQEGAKAQLPALGGWGSPEAPNCAGLKVSDLALIDFSKIDLSEFMQDVVAKVVPDGVKEAKKVTDMTNSFMTANGTDPMATDGLLVTGSATQLPPPVLPPSTNPMAGNTPPAIMPCDVAFQVTSILADGTSTGKFNIANCNPGAIIAWSNQGNCVGSPATSLDPTSSSFVSSVVDSLGKSNVSFTLPPACFAVTSPPIQNVWKGMVTLAPYGTLGVINAIW